ncbi:MAG: Transcriptional regulatory protein DegU [Anaerolineae bacterium]|nr:Transcriptional regulatory protein DegU [Anaerolineae bacterium]
MSDKIRVIVADDHAVVRQGVRDYLTDEADIEVVAEAGDGAEALAQVDALQPDVVLLDIQMPNVSGLEAVGRIKAQHPDVKILILTSYDSDPYIFNLLKTGINGYLLKTAGPDELVRAVRTVYQGRSVLGTEVMERVVESFARGRLVESEIATGDALTERELEVLKLVARGLTNIAIARQLDLSDRTVQGHLANIYAKLQAANRTEAVLKALRRGWIGLDDVAG